MNMSEINKDVVKNLTELCAIKCSDEECESILKDLENILDYIKLLEEVNTDDTIPCNHVLKDIVNIMREDEVKESMSREVFLENAPEHVGGMIKVPPIIN